MDFLARRRPPPLTRAPNVIVGPSWSDAEGNTTVANSRKKDALTGGSKFLVTIPFRENKSTGLRTKAVSKMESGSSSNPSLFVRQHQPILELWASGRTDAILKKCFSKPPSTTEIQQNRRYGGPLAPSALAARSQFLLRPQYKEAGNVSVGLGLPSFPPITFEKYQVASRSYEVVFEMYGRIPARKRNYREG